jgi:hypothetical protein
MYSNRFYHYIKNDIYLITIWRGVLEEGAERRVFSLALRLGPEEWDPGSWKRRSEGSERVPGVESVLEQKGGGKGLAEGGGFLVVKKEEIRRRLVVWSGGGRKEGEEVGRDESWFGQEMLQGFGGV